MSAADGYPGGEPEHRIGQAAVSRASSLDLSSLELTEASASIGQLTSLTHLDLSYNRLMALPDSIGQLTNLTHLDLFFNDMAALPDSIEQLTSLTELRLPGVHRT